MSKANFVKRAVAAGHTAKDTMDFLKRQETQQVLQERKPPPYFPIWGRGPGSYQMDLFFPDGLKGEVLFNIINCNTRMIYSYRLGKSKKALDIVPQLDQWLKSLPHPPSFVQSDNERAFMGKKVQEWFSKHDIEHRAVDPFDHHGQGMIERANESMRRLFAQYKAATGKSWTQAHDDLIYNLNNRVNRSIGTEPVNATEASGLFQRRLQYDLAQKFQDQFEVGDKVRKLLFKGVFDKGKHHWSRDVLTITKVDHHIFTLSDGSLAKYSDLLKVQGPEHAPDTTPESRAKAQKEETEQEKQKKAEARLSRQKLTPFLGEGLQEAPKSKKRQAKAPEVFVAAPAPPPSSIAPPKPTVKNPRAKKTADDIAWIERSRKVAKVVGKTATGYKVQFGDGHTETLSGPDIEALEFAKHGYNKTERAYIKKHKLTREQFAQYRFTQEGGS
jgi:transposase InsO family protein